MESIDDYYCCRAALSSQWGMPNNGVRRDFQPLWPLANLFCASQCTAVLDHEAAPTWHRHVPRRRSDVGSRYERETYLHKGRNASQRQKKLFGSTELFAAAPF